MLLAGLSFTACDSDNLATDQYGNEIRLNSFGPCPVLRGGVLTFLGSNLDQIESITLPGVAPITAIEVVKAGKISEIRIEVPKENCEEGLVQLTTKKGDILTTVTPVSYIENIRLDNIFVGATEGNLSGKVGDVVTIKGDYLNLIHSVIFADNVEVGEEAFLTHDRYTILVPIPVQAKSGRIQISDANPEGANTMYSDEAIEIALPTAVALDGVVVKSGNEITISGTDLDQIESVIIGGVTIEKDDLTVSSDGKTITFALPDNAVDGDIALVTASGVFIPAGTFQSVVPSELTAAPAPVKNGEVITVSGKDLDVVRSISFAGAGDGEIKTQSETTLTAVVPETATAGDLTLTMGNGKQVTVAYTLVEPTVTGFTPAELMAGNLVRIQGTDLDLVAKVIFPGEGAEVESKDFSAQTASAIGLTVPTTAEGTGCTLVLKNGTKINVASGLTIAPATDPAVSSISSPCNPGKEVTIEGKNFNNMQNLYIGTVKVVKYISRSNSKVVFIVPADIPEGIYPLNAETFEGKMVEMAQITIVAAELNLNTCTLKEDRSGLIDIPYVLGSWDNKARVMRDGYTPVLKNLTLTAGKSKLIIHKKVGTTGQCQINDPNWGPLDCPNDWNGDLDKFEIVLTQGMIDCITGATSDGWSETAFILQGQDLTVTKIGLLP